MKLSKVIEGLQRVKAKYGDREVESAPCMACGAVTGRSLVVDAASAVNAGVRITIEPILGGMFRCCIPLGEKWGHLPLPVQGQSTEDGAWVEGRGCTPQDALTAAYEVIGQAVSLSVARGAAP